MEFPNGSKTEKAAFDFAKYRRPELFAKIAELLSIPSTIITILKWIAIAVVVTWAGLPTYFAGRVHWTILTALLLYGTVAAGIVGVLLGLAAKLSKSFEDLSSVIATTISVAEEVSSDVDAMRDGNTRVPTGKETLVGVYDHVVMPGVKAAATRNAWIVGQFAFVVHKWTLDRILRKVIQAVSNDELASDTAPANDETPNEVGVTFESIDGAADRTAAWLQQAHRYVDGIGNRIQGIVTIPVVTLLTFFFVFLSLPIVAAWWFS